MNVYEYMYIVYMNFQRGDKLNNILSSIVCVIALIDLRINDKIYCFSSKRNLKKNDNPRIMEGSSCVKFPLSVRNVNLMLKNILRIEN